MPLTNTAIRNAKPSNKPIRLFDERGLYLEVSPTGGKWWRLKFLFEGKEKRLSLGVYPDVPLKDARDRRDTARKLLADGIDPSENRNAQKLARADSAANSFEVVAREWLLKYFAIWATNHGDRIIRRFECDIFPWIGGRPIAEITVPRGADIGSTNRKPGRTRNRTSCLEQLRTGIPLCNRNRTRLSCHRFRSNEVRLWLSILAYNLGNLWRRLTLPAGISD